MTNKQIDDILRACDTLSRRICSIGGERHGSAYIFNQCMRAFDAKLPAEAITFSVFINAPVMRPGVATVHSDGRLEMHTI